MSQLLVTIMQGTNVWQTEMWTTERYVADADP